MATRLFSVSPSHSPTGVLVPSTLIASATTQQCCAKWIPSIINAATRNADRSRLISSSSSRAVARTNRRDTADFDVDRAAASTASPTGSLAARCRRVASPASIRSNTRLSSWSSSSKAANDSSATSWPSSVRARGRRTATLRPPSTTDVSVAACRRAVRSASLACLGPTLAVTSACIISLITARPTDTDRASSPSRAVAAMSCNATRTDSGTPGSAATSAASSTPTSVTLLMTVPFQGLSSRTPSTMPSGTVQAGDRHLTSTDLGTTSLFERSAIRPPLVLRIRL